MRRFLRAFYILVAAASFPSGASANSSGIAGFSGKQGGICNDCHGGGTVPIVRFEGPQEVAAGTSATFRFVIESQGSAQTHSGFNVAASDGTLAAILGQGARRLAGELTHSAPKRNVDGVASFELTWTAPLTTGIQTLFGAGNSVNRNFIDTGDRASSAMLSINVIEPPPACTGDCSQDGEATVDDLVTAVNMAASTTGTAECQAVDTNRNNSVEISEIEAAIATALAGCTP